MTMRQAMEDAIQYEAFAYAGELLEELGVSMDCALDIIYLRGLNRWSEDLEEELIRIYNSGGNPDMKMFGR